MKVPTIALCCALLTSVTTMRALPTLQLDIPGGTYNTVDQTTYATTPQFTLRALLDTSNATSPSLSEMFYISAALEYDFKPLGDGISPPNVGTFTIDSQPFTAATMSWGTPPINVADNNSGAGPGNLSPHGEFPTYYAELPFLFNSSQTVPAYNTADGTTSPGVLYNHDFNVDVSGLLPGYSVHFDLYDEAIKKAAKDGTTYTCDDFAPFSHDAQSGPTSVPDGGATALLLGLGLSGVVLVRRLFRG